MNSVAREKLTVELEHLLRIKPAMGTLFVMIRETNHMLVVTLQNGALKLGYPHTGWLDVFGASRFASFCRTRGFPVRKERWWKTRMSCALIGSAAEDAASIIAECFSGVYGASGPFGLNIQGMGWQSSGKPLAADSQVDPSKRDA
jgi:hypothetical protein